MSKMLLDVKTIDLGKGYYAFYIINDFNFESLISKTEEFNRLNHYQLNIKGNNIQVIDIIDEVVKDYKPQEAFKIANVIKYILRASKKNGKQDLKKAKKYIEMLLDE